MPDTGGTGNHGPLADTDYHHVSSRVLGIANKLRELGVESALQVPTLVIAGDQSSGKSSVVEAIAGVALPRSDGTCTRCPTEVRMRTDVSLSNSAASASASGEEAAPGWQCRLKLCRDYDNEGRPLLEKPPEELFCTVYDKAHIAACVTAAQAVLLNPGAVATAPNGCRAYVPDLSGGKPKGSAATRALGGANRYELGFTANKVVLEIDGADADLTIIDLPGIIHDHPKGKHYVELVERMTKQNLAPEHHIIAMALPAGLDAETQAIRLWAREVDPSSSRSIGIITKPDTLAEGAHIAYGKLVKLVEGKAAGGSGTAGSAGSDDTQLQLGYYVVKNPGQEQLEEGISFEQAREAEARYFAANPHWSQAVAASPHVAPRLGANHLRAGLSLLLVERVEAQMPAMRRLAREQLTALEHELQAMPPPPSADPLQELRSLIWSAVEALEQHIHASSPSSKTFYQRITALYRVYSERAIQSTPAFLVNRTLVSALSNADKGLQTATVTGLPAGTVDEGEVDLTTRFTTEGAAAKALAEDEALKGELRKALFPAKHMSLQQVKELRDRHLGRELPGFSPYSAVEELIRSFKGQWSGHGLDCLEEVEAAAHEQTAAVVTQFFGRYPKALRAVSVAVAEFIEKLSAEAADSIREMAEMEDRDTFTLNDHYLRGQFTTFLGRLKRAYLGRSKLDTYGGNAVQQVASLISQLAVYGVSFKSYDDMFMSQPTERDDELQMMAACLAYFKVAFKRIQDGVPLTIRNLLLRRLADRQAFGAAVLGALQLGAGGGNKAHADAAEGARALLSEDEAVAARRTQRRDMARRLKEALAVLHSPGAAA